MQKELMRESVLESELKARHWKAQVDVMVYSMQYETLLPEYKAHLERMKEKEEQALKDFQEQMGKAKELGAKVELQEEKSE